MKVDLSPRGSGKTRRLISSLLKFRKTVLIVATAHRKEHLLRQILKMDIANEDRKIMASRRVVTIHTYINQRGWVIGTERVCEYDVLIDDADEVLQSLITGDIKKISITSK